MSLWASQEKLDALGHFKTVYKNIDQLEFHFNQQLDKLAKNGFIELKWNKDEVAVPNGINYQATLTGSGAIAQGPGAKAVGAGGVNIGGKNTGNINTGTQTRIDTGGGAYVGATYTRVVTSLAVTRLHRAFHHAIWTRCSRPFWRLSRERLRPTSKPQRCRKSRISRPRLPRASRRMTAK